MQQLLYFSPQVCSIIEDELEALTSVLLPADEVAAIYMISRENIRSFYVDNSTNLADSTKPYQRPTDLPKSFTSIVSIPYIGASHVFVIAFFLQKDNCVINKGVP